MNKIKFSVSMCVYGKDDPVWFKTAVDSILKQTLKPDEVVLVVDGPVSEKLDSVIRSYENVEGFKTVRLEVNRGHGDARRIGLENCQYEYVALMDADDISVPDRFEKQVAVISADPSLAVVGGNINEFIDDVENVVGSRVVPQKDADIKEYLKKRCPFNQVTAMLNKRMVEKAGGYLDWYCDEDYYLWLRLFLINSKFANIPENLVNVRVSKEMYARRGGWKYFKSEAKLQKFMRKNRIIGFGRYLVNVTQRLVVQVILPNKLRGWVFKKFARKKVKDGTKEV